MFRQSASASIFPLILIICNELIESPPLIRSFERTVIVNGVRLVLMHLVIEINSFSILVRVLILSQMIWNDTNLCQSFWIVSILE